MTPATNTPPVKTKVLWLPNIWVDAPHGEVTALHRVCVDVFDFYAVTPAASGEKNAHKNLEAHT